MELSQIRQKIDALNADLLRLFEERMRLCAQVASYKQENGMEVFVPSREVEILNRVRADASEENAPRTYNFDYVEDFDAEEDPLYVNLGEFVFDGRGALSGMTQFNYGYDASADSDTSSDDANTLSGYTYSLVSYEDGNLYYTREYYSGSSGSSTPILLYTDDDQISSSGWNPVTENPTAPGYGERVLLRSAGSLDGYTILTNSSNVPTGVIYTESHDERYALMSGTFSDGAIVNTFPMTDVRSEEQHV